MRAIVTIKETGETGAVLSANNVRDLTHARRLLLQAVMSVEQEGIQEVNVPRVKLELLRGFLANVGAVSKSDARRLLLMALLQLEDEDDEARFVMPHPVLPVVSPER